jgi:hypothetical protein
LEFLWHVWSVCVAFTEHASHHGSSSIQDDALFTSMMALDIRIKQVFDGLEITGQRRNLLHMGIGVMDLGLG